MKTPEEMDLLAFVEINSILNHGYLLLLLYLKPISLKRRYSFNYISPKKLPEMKPWIVTVLLCVISTSTSCQALVDFDHKLGKFIDLRDGQEYKTITFKKRMDDTVIERTWFAENVAYAVDNSYCYKDTEAYCEKFGRLYNYKAANEACPEGWHVPTITEWNYLFTFFGGRHEAGKHLIEGQESDMHMLYGGFAEPGHIFKDITISGNWWDNELKGNNSAGIITIIKDSGEIYHSVIGNNHKLSCRCVKKHD
ncbi:MAG: FISUMP domain-containing protein [Bacteroidota bacterium]